MGSLFLRFWNFIPRCGISAKRRAPIGFAVGLVISLSAGSFAYLGPWDKANSPEIFETALNRSFSRVFSESKNLSGSVLSFDYTEQTSYTKDEAKIREMKERLPWSDSYWRDKRGGIAYRPSYRESDKIVGESGFSTTLVSCEEFAEMPMKKRLNEIAHKSPAEKIDIANGNCLRSGADEDYYPTVKRVRETTGSGDAYWEGLCNGWAKASILYEEPGMQLFWKTIEIDGQDVQFPIAFMASDVKGLTSYYYGRVLPKRDIESYVMMGRDCRSDSSRDDPTNNPSRCEDVNPGAFHIVLMNLIGMRHESFYMDKDPGPEVWNHPIISYQSTVLGHYVPRSRMKTLGAERSLLIETKLKYASASFPDRREIQAALATMTVQYYLDLDSDNRIIGGGWIEGSEYRNHPDYLGLPRRVAFAGDFEILNQLIKPRGAHSRVAVSSERVRTARERTKSQASDAVKGDTKLEFLPD